MRKSSGSINNSGAYTSPGTPDYGDNYGRGTPKGWSSERVPLPANGSRRHISAAALMPFNSGRALPSKWDDAERWITSPISGYGKTFTVQPPRQPKSKSGPLGPPGVMYLPNYSPTVPVLEGGSGSNFMVGSPFTTGVLVPDGLSIHYTTGNGMKANSVYAETAIVHATTPPELSDFLNECSNPSSQDDKLDSYSEAERSVSRVISRRDMATQMSPEGSTHSSLNGNSSFSAFPLPTPAEAEQNNYNSGKVEIRDVQVDKGATITRESKKRGARRIKRKKSSDFKDLASQWNISVSAKSLSRSKREEAKITAWENLQKAKAEAAIQKLEMQLEKKRSASMEKILNKLRGAQAKAQDMRSSIAENQAHRSRMSRKAFFCKYMKTSPLIECFFCCT